MNSEVYLIKMILANPKIIIDVGEQFLNQRFFIFTIYLGLGKLKWSEILKYYD